MGLAAEPLCEVVLVAVRPENVRIIAVEEEVDVGIGGVVAAGYGAEEAQVEEAGGFEFGLVGAESGEDGFAVHGVSFADWDETSKVRCKTLVTEQGGRLANSGTRQPV